ncbi:acyltransferase [Parabacteroides bouchesdurhonensis]|uniref:acyltransferase n=1 Tax=Parabacteroides bouchesdurhonensis TaxID=1936995 RepID=UPI000E554D83|nr:acyltransferase [Parabacteroides bouchesdurhonensis]RHJ94960.1 acyltransferase [Bacteroides sp. AM07-16]
MKRIVFLDYVRVFACFLVIVVHASENFYGAAGSTDMAGPQSYLSGEADRLWVAVYDGFSRMAVPLFMIVSAFLLVPMKEEQTTWQFYRRRFTRILPPFFIFMILYSTLPLLWGQIDGETSWTDLSRILLNFPSQAGHFWFMYPLISLYLFIPVISPWLSKATAKEERFFIGLFLLSTCMPYLNRWCGEVWGQCFWNEYHMLWYFSGYLGYLVLAHYIRVHLTWGRSKRFIVGIVMMLAGAVSTIYSFYIQAIPGEILSTPVIELGWAFCTINCVVLTMGTFLMFTCINRTDSPRLITEMSKLSYGIYLMHIFWLGLWVAVFKYTLELPTVAAIPCIAVSTFACCFVTAKIISYIPGSKWVIG